MAEPLPATAGGYWPLTGQVAVVTGTTSGIGLVTAVELIRLGADVACVIRQTSDTAELDAAMAKADGCYQRVVANLDEPDEVRTIVPRVMDRFGRIDILVNSAGVADVTPFLDQTLESFDALINLDLRAPFLLCQAAGRAMVKGRPGRPDRQPELQHRIPRHPGRTRLRQRQGRPQRAHPGGRGRLRPARHHGQRRGSGIDCYPDGAGQLPRRRSAECRGRRGAHAQPARTRVSGRGRCGRRGVLVTPAARQITGQMVHVSGGAVVLSRRLALMLLRRVG